jgi:DNA polymerase-3 subunit epsilon
LACVTRVLADLEVLVIDCQAGGATPAHGDLLEIGWAVCGRQGLRSPVHQHFVVPRTERRIPAAVRELTGWSEACIAQARPEQEVWDALRHEIAQLAARNALAGAVPAVIHYARFELPFLRDLHARLEPKLEGDNAFPLDAICLHAIATRMFPDLPRRNIRALAGYLGHSTQLARRCAGHVEASAFIWQALLPRLEQLGVRSASELTDFLEQRAPARASTRRVFPLTSEQRRALPSGPGVYRFLRSNGDVLYVGKAVSLKKRVASHFSARSTPRAKGPAPTTERVLELLTQVQGVDATQTASLLEAALLESDEIKRLDPPYNVQLRSGERNAWFATRDYERAAAFPDAQHSIGPLPSERALIGLRALIALAGGEAQGAALQACALAVPSSFLPDEALFAAGFRGFADAHLGASHPSARVRVERAARALWLQRGRAEPGSPTREDQAPDAWDLDRVIRRLERCLTHGALLVRRARFLGLLTHADVAFREPTMRAARGLVLEAGRVIERCDLASVAELRTLPARRMPPRAQRRACFDAPGYDRMRVLATELTRIHAEGGEVALRFGARVLEAESVARVLRWV